MRQSSVFDIKGKCQAHGLVSVLLIDRLRNSAGLFHHHDLIYMGDLHLVLPSLNFDNGATSKIDDDLTEYGGLLHVLPLTVHLLSKSF